MMGGIRWPRPSKLARNSVVLTAGSATAQVVSAVTFLLAARQFGPILFGHVAAIYGVITFLARLLDFGAATQGMRTFARDEKANDFWNLAISRIWLTAGLFVLGCGGLVLGLDPMTCLVPFAAAAITFELFACAPLQAKERFGWVATVMIVDKITALIVFVVLHNRVRTGLGLDLIIALSIGPMVGTAFAIMKWDKRVSPFSRLPRTSPWRGAGHLGVGSLAIGLASLDVLVINWSAGAGAAGAYAAVSRWGAPFTLLAVGVSQAAFPAMIRAKDQREAMSTFWSAGRTLVVPIVLLGLLAVSAGYLVPLFLGAAYVDSVATLRMLAVALILMCASLPQITFLQARGQERSAAVILVLGTVVLFSSLVLLAPVWGATGAAVAVAVSQLVVCGFTCLSMVRLGRKEMANVAQA